MVIFANNSTYMGVSVKGLWYEAAMVKMGEPT
jgi:hypothetical protein